MTKEFSVAQRGYLTRIHEPRHYKLAVSPQHIIPYSIAVLSDNYKATIKHITPV